MHDIKEILRDAWDHREGPIVFTTVDEMGMPNSIYATCTAMDSEGNIVIADNYFNKTKRNIEHGGIGVILFITSDGTSYQLKGRISYETSGAAFEFMKSWNPPKHPGHAAVTVHLRNIFSGGDQLL